MNNQRQRGLSIIRNNISINLLISFKRQRPEGARGRPKPNSPAGTCVAEGLRVLCVVGRFWMSAECQSGKIHSLAISDILSQFGSGAASV